MSIVKIIPHRNPALRVEYGYAEVPKTHMADRLEVNRDTVRIWVKVIDKWVVFEAAEKEFGKQRLKLF